MENQTGSDPLATNVNDSTENESKPTLSTDCDTDKIKTKEKRRARRPMNAFMLWSKNRRLEIRENSVYNLHHSEISKVLGHEWKNMSVEEKRPYKLKADEMMTQHKRENPDYKYRQRRPSGSSLKKQRLAFKQCSLAHGEALMNSREYQEIFFAGHQNFFPHQLIPSLAVQRENIIGNLQNSPPKLNRTDQIAPHMDLKTYLDTLRDYTEMGERSEFYETDFAVKKNRKRLVLAKKDNMTDFSIDAILS